MVRMLAVFLAAPLFGGCAVMHHTQVGEVDSEVVLQGQRFEVMVSEVGVDVRALAETAGSDIRDIVGLFEMGPKTGNPVLDETYSDGMMERLKAECPSGRISGLISIRETAQYPLISGEIVKVIGYCMKEHR